MGSALLNLFLPLLFFVSVGLMIYASVLFSSSIKQKRNDLKSKALKIGIPALLYIVAMLSIFYFQKRS